ncbi:MAG TPA: PKD domain-containing protein [Chryseosolibacter sp.]
MKNPVLHVGFLCLAVIAVSCNEDPGLIQKPVNIDFTIFSANEAVRSLPPNSRLVVSIESQNGQTILDNQEIEFDAGENAFSTRPLDLGYGNYRITEFSVVNENDDILYAAPKEASPLSSSVQHPLDYQFSLMSGSTQGLHVRLLDVSRHKPHDFGYHSFKRTGRKLNVTVSVKGDRGRTSAEAFIVSKGDTISHYTLRAKMNQVRLPAQVGEDDRIVISKDAYTSASYPLSEILLDSENKPLRVMLSPAFTMLSFIDMSASATFEFYLGAPEGSSVSIDWGEGTSETVALGSDTYISHTYASGGNYPVTITGDLDKITYFYSFYGQGMVDAINFRHLTALQEIRFGLTRGPQVLDLSHNTKLQFALLAGLGDLENLYLPQDHELVGFMISGPNKITTAGIDAIIRNLYRNTVNKNITNGSFTLSASWAQDEGDESLVGPPSAEGLATLQLLKDNYGWTISPDPFD